MTGTATEQPEQTDRKRLQSQDFQDRTAITGLPAQNCKDKTARAEQEREDSQKRTGMQSS
jgi:hypothetical protein